MSDRFGLKVKENAGKTKYSTLNLNQTYKGTKVETKTSTGTARHGLQSLGKVGASRRIPPPANLPSLKSENSGNDPTVSLVPSGGGGWGNAKEKTSETPPVSSQAPPSTSTPSQANVPATPQPLLQPQRPSAPSTQQVQPQPQSQNLGQTQTQPFKQQQEGQTRTWSNLTSNGAGGPGRSYSHQQMPYFNREFPVLGGGGNSVERPPQEEKDHTQYGPKPMMRNMHEPPWMDRTGPGPPPLSDYGGGRDRTEMYNGGPGYSYVGGPQCRRPLDYQPGPYPKNYTQGHLPPHHSNGPSAAHGPGPGGRTPHGYPPDYHSRGPVQKPGQHAGSLHVGRPVERGRGEGYGRPAILKPEDIQAMADNEEEEEGGWAGAQEEVDYGAKLDFEDFEDDEKPYSGAIAQQKRDHTAEDMGRKQQSSEGRFGKDEESPHTRQAWTEPPAHPSPYLENRHGPTSSMRHFDSRGSPPSPGWPMPYPQHPPPQKRGGPPVHPTVQGEQGKPVPNAEEPTVNEWQKRREKQQEEMRAAVERARRRREDEELKRQHEQKAAAAAKLKQLEMKKVRRESNKEDDAWAAELDVIEKDSSSKEPLTQLQTQGHEKGIEQSHSVTTNQQDDVAARIQPSEYLNRPRNDSESSDGSRSSTSRGTSRPHHHPARDIPPRFQHQQLRQQHQYQQQQQYYHQQQPYQQQHYQQQHQYIVQQLSRSPQYRDFPEGPLTVISHQPVTEPAPVSPSQTPSKTDQPVRRIMKRSDSSSTAGDDVASVKSVESVSSETIRGGQKRSSADPADTVQKVEQPVAIQKTLGGPERSNLDRKEKEAHDDKGVSVFDELEDEKKRQHSDVSKSQSLVFNKEKTQAKEKMQEKKERRVANDKESRTDKEGEMRERRDERCSSKRDARHQEYRHEDDARDFGKRKRDESEDGAWVEDRKVKISGRNESKREYHPELRGRGRVSFPVRGRGRGMGSSSFRGRGRGDYRGSRDSRDYREPRQIRAHESKLSSTSSELQETVEQKQTGEDKEDDVVAGSCAVAASKKKNESIPKNSTEASNKKPVESSSADIEKPCEKPLRGDVEESCKEVRKEEKVTQDDEHKAIVENRDISSKTLDNDGVKSKTRRDSRKSRESYKESNDNTPTQFKGRGGFGKPPQASRDYKKGTDQDRRQTGKRFTDRRHTTQELSRDRNAHYDQRRSIRNYSKDQTNQKLTGREQNRNRERDREGDNRRSFRYDNRDVSNRRPMEDDRRKKGGDRGDDSQHSKQRDDRNQRGGYRPFSRGRFGRTPARGSSRGGRSSYPVGSGRLGTNYRRSRSTDEEISDDDYTDSESSSYTTATSASEERRDEKTSEVEKEGDINRGKEDGLMQEKPRLSSWSARSPIRGKSLPRGGGRGGGGFGRSRREVERPPRFQKQQERERASFGRGVSRGVRQSEGREGGPVRGQGRGRGRSRRELPGKDSFEGPGIPVTEDWDDESVKEAEPSKNDKSIERRESSFRRGFSGQRSSTDRPRRDKNRDTGGTRNAFSRREPFLVERQQAKVEGSKSASGEPQLHLPAARNSLTRDGSAAFHNKKLDKQGLVYNAVDNFSAGDNRVPKKAEQNNKKTDIQQYDLHNFAGVFVIDDMTDDDSDISSTLSGFVEVTSRRTQKENKEKFREEEERRKKDEYNRQRGNQMGSKKTQSVKPPRFSKQHTTSSPPSKSGVISKIASSFVSEVNAGAAPAGGNSNASSTSSTKRNSPVNVERPLSPPPPPPVFNAWDKPLIVTPAKPPSATPMMTSSVPDPLAVGSGKPSTRTAQMKTAISSSAAALIEDKSVDDDYIAMTKEIALLAPPEEPEEPEHPKPQLIQETSQTRVENQDQVPAKPGKMTDNTEKKSQPKPQREKPPRFDRGAKRRPTTSKDETKKEHSEGSKGRKNSRDTSVFQKSPPKGETDDSSKRETVTSETPSQSAATGGQSVMDLSAPRGGQGSDGKTTDTVEDFSTPSDKGTEEKDDVKQESEEHEAKDDSETESSRKDSEPDLNVDSAERNDQTGDLFSTRTLTADIRGRSGPDRPDREPSPVSPDFVKMTKNLEVSRKLWEEPELSIPIPSTWEETLCTSANVSTSVVGMSVVESNNDPQVPVSKSQVELEAASNKTDSKPVDNTNFAKKTGEQQNVCKVKPQQQQPVKPQQTLASGPQVVDEIRQPEMNAVPPSQPLLTQDHLSQQQSIPPRLAFSFPFVDMQHRPQFLQQQLQQSNQVAHAFPLTHVQPPVNQGRSSSSPLSQTPQDIYPSYLPSTVYSTGNFPGSQSFVPIALLSNTTTQSFATSTSRTQTTSLMGIQAQQPKTGTGSVFAPGVTHTGAQHMYMSFDPQTLSGGRPLFNQPQPSQRHLLGAQTGIMGDHIPRQGGFASAQQTHQPFQQNYPFQQKLSTFEVTQDISVQKTPNQGTADLIRQSELAKHINAKPFEPPKRSTPSSVPTSNAEIAALVSSAFVRNPNLIPLRPSPPAMAASSQSPPVTNSLISGRPMSMSPVDPTVPFPGAVGTFPKHTAVGQYHLQQQPRTVQPQRFTPFQQQPVSLQHTLQISPQGGQQQQGVNQLSGGAAAILSNQAVVAATLPRQIIRTTGLGSVSMTGAQPTAPGAQRFPRPIQRPMPASLIHSIPHMQAPQGPRAQTVPVQMAPMKQQIMSARPQIPAPPPPPPQQDPATAAFKSEEHDKMVEQTKMFFAQHEQQQQQRTPHQSAQSGNQLPKVAPAGTNTQGSKLTGNVEVASENSKPLEKKEETKPHVIELNPRMRKPTLEQAAKAIKITKTESKPEDSSKDRTSKQDGKGNGNKRSGPVPITPLPQQRPLPSRNRPNPNRSRGPPRVPGAMPSSKAKISVRPEKEANSIAIDQPVETQSPKNADQAKVSNAQSVQPLSISK